MAFVMITACDKEDDGPALSAAEQLARDITIIEEYLQQEGLVAERTASGLHYIIDVEGTGGHPSSNSDVEVTYKGYLTDKTVFDPGSRTSFSLTRVIEGWTEGIPLFKKGGKGVLLIPSELGYGRFPPTSTIPPNAVLIFDVELHAFL